MSNTDELRQNLRELAVKATPGPWRTAPHNYPKSQKWDHRVITDEFFGDLIATTVTSPAYEKDVDNAKYMAAANPQAILALLDEIELSRKRLEFMINEGCIIGSMNGMGTPLVYSLFWPQTGESQTEWYSSPEAAIDAAMESNNET